MLAGGLTPHEVNISKSTAAFGASVLGNGGRTAPVESVIVTSVAVSVPMFRSVWITSPRRSTRNAIFGGLARSTCSSAAAAARSAALADCSAASADRFADRLASDACCRELKMANSDSSVATMLTISAATPMIQECAA